MLSTELLALEEMAAMRLYLGERFDWPAAGEPWAEPEILLLRGSEELLVLLVLLVLLWCLVMSGELRADSTSLLCEH